METKIKTEERGQLTNEKCLERHIKQIRKGKQRRLCIFKLLFKQLNSSIIIATYLNLLLILINT